MERLGIRILTDPEDVKFTYRFLNLPKITLSASDEVGQAESSIAVLKQRHYSGEMPVISSALADTSCADLGVDGVLKNINATLGTSYTFGFVTTIHSILEPYVERKDDFGAAYARLRGYWHDIHTLEQRSRLHEHKDREMRQKMLMDGKITDAFISPRRVWDLYANRVVPYWVGGVTYPMGISHAWMDERQNVWTPINRYEWPVPMPNDADLNLIRIEMLNEGAEYAWLDVLCLRQKYDAREDHLEEDRRREDLRMEEWTMDVPTIGAVYAMALRVVCYINGLGRPISSLTSDDFESHRCWFNRAWTLQETKTGFITGGETNDGNMEEDTQIRINEEFASLELMLLVGNCIFHYLSPMQKRVSTNPVDKVAGLASLLWPRYIPIYNATESEESAWVSLVNALEYYDRAQCFFLYPEPESGVRCWRPSWDQVMTRLPRFPDYDLSALYFGEVNRTELEAEDADWYMGYHIDLGDVRGLDNISKEGRPQNGTLIVKDDGGTPHTFGILVKHEYLIPDGPYTLIGRTWSWDIRRRIYPGYGWVIGWQRPNGRFEKLSVLGIDDMPKLIDLGLAKPNVKIFLC